MSRRAPILVPCPCCNNSVSRAARVCPHCGHPQVSDPYGTSGHTATVILLLILLFILIGSLL